MSVHKVGLFTARFLRPQLYQIIDYGYAKLSSSYTAESDDIPSLASAMRTLDEAYQATAIPRAASAIPGLATAILSLATAIPN